MVILRIDAEWGSVDEAGLREMAERAAGLDRLVPKIAEALRAAQDPADFKRLSDLLKLAERFLLDAGPIMSRTKPEPGPLRDTVERFLRELPRRLHMVRDAQSVLPPLSRDEHFAQVG
jgi:hypothetical protein